MAGLRQSDILATAGGMLQNRTDEELHIASELTEIPEIDTLSTRTINVVDFDDIIEELAAVELDRLTGEERDVGEDPSTPPPNPPT